MRCSACVVAVATACSLVYAKDRPTMESLKATASDIAKELRSKFTGSILYPVPGGYWWWQSALVTDAFITYGSITGDKQYEEICRDTLSSQATANYDFMVENLATGNDDQAWWALAAIAADKNGIESRAGQPSFLEMAKKVFNEQKGRWQSETCAGGLKWGIIEGGHGWTYRSTITQGLFSMVAAELGVLSNDGDMLSWVGKTYDWAVGAGLIDGASNVYDGLGDTKTGGPSGCETPNKRQWSYNAGVFLYTSAVVASYTSDATWIQRTKNLTTAAIRNFVRDGQLFEPICGALEDCEKCKKCNEDQRSFLGILARWLGMTAAARPELQGQIAELLDGQAAYVQGNWNATSDPIQLYVSLEIINAAARARGGDAGAAKRPGKRSVAGRTSWEV